MQMRYYEQDEMSSESDSQNELNLDDDLTPKFINICSFETVPDLSEFYNSLADVEELSTPEILHNKSIYIDFDDHEESEVLYSNHTPEPPEGISQSAIVADYSHDEDENPQVHAHAWIEYEHNEELLEYYREVLEIMDGMMLHNLNIYFEINRPFSDWEFLSELDIESTPAGMSLDWRGHEFNFYTSGSSTRGRFDYLEGKDKGEIGDSAVRIGELVEDNINLISDYIGNRVR